MQRSPLELGLGTSATRLGHQGELIGPTIPGTSQHVYGAERPLGPEQPTGPEGQSSGLVQPIV